MIPKRPTRAPNAKKIQDARDHVALAVKKVDDQRGRVKRLQQGGHSTVDAETLLATFEEVLLPMRQHLATEEGLRGNA